jgi:hypothetical protein
MDARRFVVDGEGEEGEEGEEDRGSILNGC